MASQRIYRVIRVRYNAPQAPEHVSTLIVGALRHSEEYRSLWVPFLRPCVGQLNPTDFSNSACGGMPGQRRPKCESLDYWTS